ARPGVDHPVAGAAPHLHRAAGHQGRRPGPRRHHPLSLRPGVGTAGPASPGPAWSNGAMMSPVPHQRDDAARRRGVVRTAWIVGVIALAVYVGFILSGVLNA